ncbi:hypothetical protein AC579_7619, partial [Pseudocercospora musae]
MPDTEVEFAWAIPVKVDIVGAHLEAYKNLQPLSRGSFDQLSAILLKDCGLELWSSHVHEAREAPFANLSNTHSTKAYLRLPTKSTVLHEAKLDFEDWDYDPRRVPTETGYAGPLCLPPQPSAKCLARFARAMRLLQLDYDKCDELHKSPVCDKTPIQDDEVGAEEHEQCNQTTETPQLTMFLRAGDDAVD